MSMQKAWYVRCDRCGEGVVLSRIGARDARHRAKIWGFSMKPGDFDVCPQCTYELEQGSDA